MPLGGKHYFHSITGTEIFLNASGLYTSIPCLCAWKQKYFCFNSQCRVKFRGFCLQKKKKSSKKSSVCSSYMFGIFFHVWFFFVVKKNSTYVLGHAWIFFSNFWELVIPHASPMNLLGIFKQIIFSAFFKVRKLIAVRRLANRPFRNDIDKVPMN